MNSCLYEGLVTHHRSQPVGHGFKTRIGLFYLDLDELTEVFQGRWFGTLERPSLARFRRQDYLPAASGELKPAVVEAARSWCQSRGLPQPPESAFHRVCLLAQIRQFGYLFNPIALYYCFDAADDLTCVVAEVTNTPWNERKVYVLGKWQAGFPNDVTMPKEFHVSPFMPMAMTYHWKLSRPTATLTASVANEADGERVFVASLHLQRKAFSRRAMSTAFLRFPAMSLWTMSAIYWQALRLWLKRCPAYPHPASLEPESPSSVR